MKLQIIFFEKIGTLITNILYNVTTDTVSDKTCFPVLKKMFRLIVSVFYMFIR